MNTALKETLKNHVAQKRSSQDIIDLMSNIFNTINRYNAEEDIALTLLNAFEKNPNQTLFIALLCDSTQDVLAHMNQGDLRIQATYHALKASKVNESSIVTPLYLTQAFAQGVYSQHSTLIQCFYRILGMVSLVMSNNAAKENLTRKVAQTSFKSEAPSKILSAILQINAIVSEYVESDVLQENHLTKLTELLPENTYLPYI